MSHQILLGAILRLGVKGHHGLRIVILVLIVAAIVVVFVLVRQRRPSRPARTARRRLALMTRGNPVPPGDRPDAGVPNLTMSSNNELQAQGVGTVTTAVRQSRAGKTLGTIEARGLTKRYGDKLAPSRGWCPPRSQGDPSRSQRLFPSADACPDESHSKEARRGRARSCRAVGGGPAAGGQFLSRHGPTSRYRGGAAR